MEYSRIKISTSYLDCKKTEKIQNISQKRISSSEISGLILTIVLFAIILYPLATNSSDPYKLQYLLKEFTESFFNSQMESSDEYSKKIIQTINGKEHTITVKLKTELKNYPRAELIY